MYLYDTRNNDNEKKRFPIHGWIFPCLICGTIMGYKKSIIFEKTTFCKSKYIKIPCCKNCEIDENFILDKKL